MWLIGKEIRSFAKKGLPSKKNVLALFAHFHFTKGNSVDFSAKIVANKLNSLWSSFKIPTQPTHRIAKKVKTLYNAWRLLTKNKEKKSLTQDQKEGYSQVFLSDLESLFDVAHGNYAQLIKNKSIREFLDSQKNKDSQVPSQIIKEQARKIRKKAKRLKIEKIDHSNENPSKSSTQDSESSSIASINGNDSLFSSPKKNDRKGRKLNIMKTELVPILDRSKISNRQAAAILPSVASSLGHETGNMTISYSTVRRVRQQERKVMADNIRNSANLDPPLTVHWDGKLIPSTSNNQKEERLPIIVSTGSGVEQLLEIPKCAAGTGKIISDKIYDALKTWNLCPVVSAMCFDTTASNTGAKNGACVGVETKLGKELLYFACRHHIFEIILDAAFTACFGPSTGPDISIFKRFQERWKDIDQSCFCNSLDDKFFESISDCERTEIIDFCECKLRITQPRDDYKELLELVLLCMGQEYGANFKIPGAMHRARWLAKAIYSLKIYLFRDQFKMTKRELKSIRRICIFICKIYIFAWYEAPVAISAPRNDFVFLKKLIKYDEIDSQISSIVVKKFSNHLWYLSDELICLCLFDESVEKSTKVEIQELLLASHYTVDGKRNVRGQIDVQNIDQMKLENFASKRSRKFFKILNIEDEFLQQDFDTWSSNDSFIQCKKILKNLKVVNDIAERGVALIQEYNQLHTKNEKEKQDMLLGVAKNRKDLPDFRKTSILSYLHR